MIGIRQFFVLSWLLRCVKDFKFFSALENALVTSCGTNKIKSRLFCTEKLPRNYFFFYFYGYKYIEIIYTVKHTSVSNHVKYNAEVMNYSQSVQSNS